MHPAFPWLGFFFWVGLFTWFGVVAWSRHLSEVERQRTLRAFAERGTPLDKDMLEKLMATRSGRTPEQWQSSPQATARGLAIGGIVTLFAGAGLLIGAQLLGQIERDALFSMSTFGVIAGSVGLGLITSSWVLRRMHAADKKQAAGVGDDLR
jgi:hypothetical protein